MNIPLHASIIRAVVTPEGRLLSADEPLLALQREAGGDLAGPILIPQLAIIARLVTRLRVPISRPIVAAAARGDIDMWVRAAPDDAGAQLSIVEWHERPAAAGSGDFAARDADLAALAEGWIWQIDTQMQFQLALDGQGEAGRLPAQPPLPGGRFSSYFRLQPDEDGDMAILRGFAQRRAFRGQAASLAVDESRMFTLSGFPLFDVAGQLIAYRGKALSDPEATAAAREVVTLYPAEFGRRLDRSLRQPLGRIIANADTISAQLEGPLRQDYAEYATDIAAAGRHLMALVDDLADLQAVDRPDFTVIAEDVDLADLGRRAAGLLSVKALDRQIHVVAPDLSISMPATGEFRRVLQILVNLIGNAIRYSPEGSTVRVITEGDGREARIVVTDEGGGVPVDSRERIFEKFERLGRDDPGGSGLGLYISRRLARAMGGDIRIGGEAGQGARFILSLPATG
ncbi:HAMP domain-containing sensor histidine kinase [Sphingobium sp. AN558]|uniref:sensor histidine kinase n=1 Tax=Sphingobium sp. AN558 TaxID=3133442 RepID=UPI0030C6041E